MRGPHGQAPPLSSPVLASESATHTFKASLLGTIHCLMFYFFAFQGIPQDWKIQRPCWRCSQPHSHISSSAQSHPSSCSSLSVTFQPSSASMFACHCSSLCLDVRMFFLSLSSQFLAEGVHDFHLLFLSKDKNICDLSSDSLKKFALARRARSFPEVPLCNLSDGDVHTLLHGCVFYARCSEALRDALLHPHGGIQVNAGGHGCYGVSIRQA